jgi:serine/threonine protein kinase
LRESFSNAEVPVMISEGSNVHNTINIRELQRELIDPITASNIQDLKQLDYDWSSNTFNLQSNLSKILTKSGFTEQHRQNSLSQSGRLFLSRILLNFQFEVKVGDVLSGKYKIIKKIKVGKNSAVYLATHRSLGMSVVLKLIRPGAANELENSLQLLGKLTNKSGIVRPVDLFEVELHDILKKPVVVSCIVFPRIEGTTLREFLNQKSYHLNSHVALAFIKQVGGALAELEQSGAYHGDLHDENIIVEQNASGLLSFLVIDVSFGLMGSLSANECKNSDLSQFRQLVWRILSFQKASLSKMSLRKYLGTKQFLAISKILEGQGETFASLLSFVKSEVDFNLYSTEKKIFLESKFNTPKTFRLQRYEEIIDPSEAARLFVPFPELMERIEGFSNVFVSGNRGSGKSTYLASLGFFPENKSPFVDFKEILGIYFPCRQGEFKALRGNENWSKEKAQERTTAIVVTKVVRRTLETLAVAVAASLITVPQDLTPLRIVLNRFVPQPGLISVGDDIQPEIENFVSTILRVEMELLSNFRANENLSANQIQLHALIEFFSSLRSVFPELSNTRFHILFDDAGAPNLTLDVQKVLCDLMMTSNPIFCVKFSAEKFTFRFESSVGKVPENGHDYFEHDISYLLLIGSPTARMARRALREHLRKIIELRLEQFKFGSRNIIDYLGDNESSSEILIKKLSSGQEANYAGWTVVWNTADRTPRVLLELVSEIFAYAEISAESKPRLIDGKIQDKAIRTISEKRLQSLSQISGDITLGNKKQSLGRRLFEVTASIGSVFRTYLKEQSGKYRPRQHLAIERNDLENLSAEADEVLNKLISFGVLDDSKAEYARDDAVKKPIYVLNHIYCPAFNITFRRDEHLRLSKAKFELLLLSPQGFLRQGTKRLAALAANEEPLDGLFGFKFDE